MHNRSEYAHSVPKILKSSDGFSFWEGGCRFAGGGCFLPITITLRHPSVNHARALSVNLNLYMPNAQSP